MPKAYDPQAVEKDLYAAWEESGFFNPDNLPGERKETFSMSLPPPNVTGTLHVGHAVMLAIQDIMVRFARMRGKKTLWLPGTDHAAIATQTKVEKLLIKEGMKDPRHELGREKFLERVDKYAKESHDTIVEQSKRMGASLDWSREAFTLDEPRTLAVRTAFKRMYDDGLIYRGDRVVNWCPRCKSTLADDEVEHKETTAKLYTFKYDKNFPITISTTRPETKFGDTAVAVHPKDKRYKKFIGKTLRAHYDGSDLTIKVIADDEVDPEFGTGALGVTPSHSNIDADMASRHNLESLQVINEEGKMVNAPGVNDLSSQEARAHAVDWLRNEGLLQNEEDSPQNKSVCYRCGAAVEPLPKLQWFIDVNKKIPGRDKTLKELMLETVRKKDVEIIPERFEKVYFHWIENLRDWNISRQIWYGHQVPAWYKDEEIYVGTEAPEGEGWTQDQDTLDTWFSSGLWTFSTLGWPNDTEDFKTYHPTTVMETGWDILFFWVARMILMSTYLLDTVPFKHVYLHGLIRDEEGRKMSKSLDNIIDPLDVSDKYGTDAVRLSLVVGSTPGQDVSLSEEKIASYRNFANKLWNISRFVFGSVEDVEIVEDVEAKTLADEWVLERLLQVTDSVTKKLDTFQFSQAAEELREFTWNDFADWYLEIAKIEGDKDEMLLFVLERILSLWHPFIPFVTEEIWKRFETGEFLIVHEWPEEKMENGKLEMGAQMKHIQEVIVAIRNLRSENKVETKKKVDVTLISKKGSELLESQKDLIAGLSRVETLRVTDKKEKLENSAMTVVGKTEVYLSLEGLVDLEVEKERLGKELKEAETYSAQLKSKLDNKTFIGKAPKEVIEGIKEKYEETQERIQKIQEQLKGIN